MRAALYARVSTHDQQTLAMQRDAMHEFATRRGWTVIDTVEEIASGAKDRRQQRHQSTGNKNPAALGVGFVSLTEALDLTTPAGRAFAGFLAVFAEFERDLIRERIKAGITDARKRGKAHGRPRATANDAAQIRTLAQHGLSQAASA